MKIDKKLKLQGEKPTERLTRGSAPATRWGLRPRPSFSLAIRALATIPLLGKSWIRHWMLGLGVNSQKLNT